MTSEHKPIPFDVFAPDCPSRKAFDQIFSRWGILVLARLSNSPVRFGALHRAIGGISEKMLAQTLKTLEEEHMVQRQVYDEKPPRVEYSLTESGSRISESVGGVIGELYRALDRNKTSTTSSS